jgi:hypothetical protein
MIGTHTFYANATTSVLPVRHGLKVGGVTAGAVPTEMVELEAIWDRADEQFVGNPMRVEHLAVLAA